MNSPRRPAQTLAAATSFFNGERRAMARQLAGLKKAHLAALIEMSPASVTAWESCAKQPNRTTVAKLALALRVEPQFFGGGAPPRVNKPHFRSLRSTPQIAQDEAEAYGQFVAEVTGMLENAVEFPPVLSLDLPVDPEEHTTTPEDAAKQARAFFSVGPGPIKHVIRLAERAGVVVVFSEPGIAAIDAYSLHTATRPTLIYRARALGIMRDVSYRNAMVRMSQNGWRRAEPGRVTSLEMPSMLPRAREVMGSAGIDDDKFLSGSGLPAALYEIAASRVPLTGDPT